MSTSFVELSPCVAVSAIAMQLLLKVLLGVIKEPLSPRCTRHFALESNNIIDITYSQKHIISEYVNQTPCIYCCSCLTVGVHAAYPSRL